MTSFKVGDRVKVIKFPRDEINSADDLIGSTGTVHGFSAYIHVLHDTDLTTYWHDNIGKYHEVELELLEETAEKLSPGTRVRVKTGGNHGKTGSIKKEWDAIPNRYDVSLDEGCTIGVSVNELEVLPPLTEWDAFLAAEAAFKKAKEAHDDAAKVLADAKLNLRKRVG